MLTVTQTAAPDPGKTFTPAVFSGVQGGTFIAMLNDLEGAGSSAAGSQTEKEETIGTLPSVPAAQKSPPLKGTDKPAQKGKLPERFSAGIVIAAMTQLLPAPVEPIQLPPSQSTNFTATNSMEGDPVGEAPIASLPVAAKVIASSGSAFVFASPLPSVPTITHEFRGQSEEVADSRAPTHISIERFREAKALNADPQPSSQQLDIQGTHASSAFRTDAAGNSIPIQLAANTDREPPALRGAPLQPHPSPNNQSDGAQVRIAVPLPATPDTPRADADLEVIKNVSQLSLSTTTGALGPKGESRSNSLPTNTSAHIGATGAQALLHSIESSAKSLLASPTLANSERSNVPQFQFRPGIQRSRSLLEANELPRGVSRLIDKGNQSLKSTYPQAKAASDNGSIADRGNDTGLRQNRPSFPPLTETALNSGPTSAAGQVDIASPVLSGNALTSDTPLKLDQRHPEQSNNTPAFESGPAAATVPVHTARIFQDSDRAEMRIGLHTENFGAIQIHTSASAKQVDIALGSERGDLRGFLASELPSLRDHLHERALHSQEHGTQAQMSGGNPDSFSGAGGNRSHSWRQSGSLRKGVFDVTESATEERGKVANTVLNVTV